MAKISVKRFVELLQKSGLVPDTLLRDALSQIKQKNNGKPLGDLDFVTEHLIDMGLVTEWQTDKLLSQKYKGFFLGKYKILGHLGTGGMSTVYLVEHAQMHQRRAVKVLPKKKVHDKTYLERFYIEARASSSLDHPNIVRAFDVDQDPESGTHYLIMEFVDGMDVGKIVAESGPFAPRDAAGFIAQAADALQFAHEQKVVHRDVKPGNLLIDKNNEVKILDMGLALFKDDDYSLTIAHNEKILGTADYLAPEQALNSHAVDYRADIYGLGCTLYFMLAGEPPFNEGSLAQRIIMHQTKSPDPISVYRDDCPDELQAILDKMMAKDPDQRMQSCTEVHKTLTDWLAGKPIHLAKTVGVSSDYHADDGLPPGNSDVLESDISSDESSLILETNSLRSSGDETLRSVSADIGDSSIISSGSVIQVNAVSFSDIVAESKIHSSKSNLIASDSSTENPSDENESNSVIELMPDPANRPAPASIPRPIRIRKLGEKTVVEGGEFKRKKVIEMSPSLLAITIGVTVVFSAGITALVMLFTQS